MKTNETMRTKSKQIIIGIDGGGSASECVITDTEGRLIGSGIGKGSNINFVGEEAAYEAIASALLKAGFSETHEVLAVCLGASGVKIDRENKQWISLINKLIPYVEKIFIVNDAMNALAGAIGLQKGICVNSGTGSFGTGWDDNRNFVYVSGWGPFLGDEGSGYWIGLEGIKSVLRGEDNRCKPTILKNSLKSVFQEDDIYKITQKITKTKKQQELISKICPLVFRCAELGDEIALDIIKRGAHELALNAKAVAIQLGFMDVEIDIAMVGSVLISNRLIEHFFRIEVQKMLPKSKVVFPRYPPVIGSVILAFDGINLIPDNNNFIDFVSMKPVKN